MFDLFYGFAQLAFSKKTMKAVEILKTMEKKKEKQENKKTTKGTPVKIWRRKIGRRFGENLHGSGRQILLVPSGFPPECQHSSMSLRLMFAAQSFSVLKWWQLHVWICIHVEEWQQDFLRKFDKFESYVMCMIFSSITSNNSKNSNKKNKRRMDPVLAGQHPSSPP